MGLIRPREVDPDGPHTPLESPDPTMTKIRIRWIAAIALAVAAGCGQGDGIKLVPVNGTITRAGKPVADASLSFVPDPGNKQSTAGTAVSGPTGYYSVMYQTRSGLAPGNYNVMVIPGLDAAAVPPEFANDPLMAQYGNAARKAAAPAKPSAAKSEFKAKIEDQGGTFDFDLGPAIP
jgi:hypothetical protein